MHHRAIHVRWLHCAIAAMGIAVAATVLVFAVRMGREMGRYLETSTGLTSEGVAAAGHAPLPLPEAPAARADSAVAGTRAIETHVNEDAADLRADSVSVATSPD